MLRHLLLLSLASTSLSAQWTHRASGTGASLRGLSAVNSRVAWASGSRGTVIRTQDGGQTWANVSIPDAGSRDLRAIHALSEDVAVVAATAGRIWRTSDGGRTWSLRYEAADTSTFLDAIAFSDTSHGLVLGDPLDGRFLLLETRDGGLTWKDVPAARRPATLPGEAAFAASGTSLLTRGSEIWVGSGGGTSRIHYSADAGGRWQAWPVPMHAGGSSQGVFALVTQGAELLAVGGDFSKDSLTAINIARLDAKTGIPRAVTSRPHGYRSGLAAHGSTVIAVGPAGSDISRDGGQTWAAFDPVGFHAVRASADGTFYASGSDGRVAVFRPASTR